MTYSSIGDRFLATLADGLVTVPLLIVMSAMFGDASAGGGSASFNLSGWPFLLYLAVTFAYFGVTEAIWGRSLGKWMTGLRVVDADGGAITPVQSALRNVLRFVDVLPFGYIVAAITVSASDQNQRVGDHAAKTYVVSWRAMEKARAFEARVAADATRSAASDPTPG